MEELLGVVIIIFNEKDHTILVGERINSYKSGSYGLPGGRINLKESLLSAAQRELKEETGIEISTNELTYIGAIREFQETYNFIHFAFLLKNPSQTAENKEPDKCKDWEWMSLESLPKNILRGHKAAISIWKNNTLYEDLL